MIGTRNRLMAMARRSLNLGSNPVLVASLAFLVTGLTPAAAGAGERESTVVLYLWGAGLDGTVAMGGTVTDVDMSFGDIVDNLDAGAQARLETHKDRWRVLADFIYMDLGHEAANLPAELEVKQSVFEVLGGYSVSPSFDVLFGGRYSELDNRVAFSGPLGLGPLTDRHSWVDPVIGGRYRGGGERFHYSLRADVAGFGVGSELTWNAEAVVSWDVSPRVVLGASYRVNDVDFEEGSGDNLFQYEMTTAGPAFGVGFRF